MKLLEEGQYSVSPAVDPQTIVWENLGTPTPTKVKRMAFTIMFTVSIFLASFFGIWGISLFEKLRNDWGLSECNGEDVFMNQVAFDDYMNPKPLKNGLMHCYCK